MAVYAWRLAQPADIEGDWTGERWPRVSLSTVEEANGWYRGSFTNASGERGAMQLEWSALQMRYNGRWKVGEKLSGSLTLRVAGGDIRGAVSVDPEAPASSDTPRLRDFVWKRSAAGSANVEDELGQDATETVRRGRTADLHPIADPGAHRALARRRSRTNPGRSRRRYRRSCEPRWRFGPSAA